VNWLKSPSNRSIIARRTSGGKGRAFALELPQPPHPDRFTFLVLGDSGDSEAVSTGLSPQEAVARELVKDTCAAEPRGAAMVLHTGDVVYMTGERRLYDRNFRRPYAELLAPGSTVDNLIFRLPFLPVPGNHDYYDLGSWAQLLSRVPFLGGGLQAVAREVFGYNLPRGGSDMGAAYMQAFVDGAGADPLPYRPGEQTRVPNRYYRFEMGSVHFFALDSNTLDAPPPAADGAAVRAEAARRVRELEGRLRTVQRELLQHEQALDRWRVRERLTLVESPDRLAALQTASEDVRRALGALAAGVTETGACAGQAAGVRQVQAAWTSAWSEMERRSDAAARAAAFPELDAAGGRACEALVRVEGCLAELPDGPGRESILTGRAEVERALAAWTFLASPTPAEDLETRLRELSESALDLQRELAQERARARYVPADYDAPQMDWLARALEESERAAPDAWRIVYLHHPLYTTIRNHAERADVQGVRANLLPLLRGRAHLVLTGHSHGFEWIHSGAMPDTGVFVTGGGGQVSLRSSILSPRYFNRYRDRYRSIREAGARECVVAGRGPAADDGETGALYHYLRIEVLPDVIRVRPVGVRRLRGGGYRREEPMPVFHAPELSREWDAGERPGWVSRRLDAVEVRREERPRPLWA
jgi:hypothetical protein